MNENKFYEFLNHAVDVFVDAGYHVTVSSTVSPNADCELYLNAYYIPETAEAYPDFMAGMSEEPEVEINVNYKTDE